MRNAKDQRMTTRRRRGSNAVEFALILPVLTAFMCAVMDYGNYFIVEGWGQEAVRNAARMAVTKATTTEMNTVAEYHVRDTLLNYNLTCLSVENCVIQKKHTRREYSGEFFTVFELTVRRPYAPLIGVIPTPKYHIFHATMRYEIEP